MYVRDPAKRTNIRRLSGGVNSPPISPYQLGGMAPAPKGLLASELFHDVGEKLSVKGHPLGKQEPLLGLDPLGVSTIRHRSDGKLGLGMSGSSRAGLGEGPRHAGAKNTTANTSKKPLARRNNLEAEDLVA